MRSYPCVIVGLPDDYVRRHVREGDEITFQHASDAVACFHGRERIGHLPQGRWVSRSLAQGDNHQVRVTGFDITDSGEFAAVEIEITILAEEGRDPDPLARSIISEIGDELRLLAMVAAVDGRVAPAEKALLERFAETRAREMGLDPQEGEAAHAVRWARRKAADSLDAAQIIGRLAIERPSALPILLEGCELMAEIDGTVGQQEKHTVSMLRNLLQHGLNVAKDNRQPS